jgi:hypothetical protein
MDSWKNHTLCDYNRDNDKFFASSSKYGIVWNTFSDRGDCTSITRFSPNEKNKRYFIKGLNRYISHWIEFDNYITCESYDGTHIIDKKLLLKNGIVDSRVFRFRARNHIIINNDKINPNQQKIPVNDFESIIFSFAFSNKYFVKIFGEYYLFDKKTSKIEYLNGDYKYKGRENESGEFRLLVSKYFLIIAYHSTEITFIYFDKISWRNNKILLSKDEKSIELKLNNFNIGLGANLPIEYYENLVLISSIQGASSGKLYIFGLNNEKMFFRKMEEIKSTSLCKIYNNIIYSFSDLNQYYIYNNNLPIVSLLGK